MLVKLFAEVRKEIPNVRLYIVGAPVREADRAYEQALHQYVTENALTNAVTFMGAVPNKDLPAIYQKARVCVNLSTTGSLDKTVLEAMACNVPVVTTNEAFQKVAPSGHYSRRVSDIEQKIIELLQYGSSINYRHIVIHDHSLPRLIAALVGKLNSL